MALVDEDTAGEKEPVSVSSSGESFSKPEPKPSEEFVRNRNASEESGKDNCKCSDSGNSEFSIANILGIPADSALPDRCQSEEFNLKKWRMADAMMSSGEIDPSALHDKWLPLGGASLFTKGMPQSAANNSARSFRLSEDQHWPSPEDGPKSMDTSSSKEESRSRHHSEGQNESQTKDTLNGSDKCRLLLDPFANPNAIGHRDMDSGRRLASALCNYYNGFSPLTPQWKIWQELMLRRTAAKISQNDPGRVLPGFLPYSPQGSHAAHLDNAAWRNVIESSTPSRCFFQHSGSPLLMPKPSPQELNLAERRVLLQKEGILFFL